MPKPVRIALTPVGQCDICERREADCTVTLDGEITAICDTCLDRYEDEGYPNA